MPSVVKPFDRAAQCREIARSPQVRAKISASAKARYALSSFFDGALRIAATAEAPAQAAPSLPCAGAEGGL